MSDEQSPLKAMSDEELNREIAELRDEIVQDKKPCQDVRTVSVETLDSFREAHDEQDRRQRGKGEQR